jgi:hypothetical protein
MAKAQVFMMNLIKTEAELRKKWDDVKAELALTADEVAALEAGFKKNDCEANYELAVAAAKAKNVRALARIEKNKVVG